MVITRSYQVDCMFCDRGRGSYVHPILRTIARLHVCERWGRQLPSECWRMKGAFYLFGSKEHMRRDCPRVVRDSSVQDIAGIVLARARYESVGTDGTHQGAAEK
ncbi:hypothetical protein V6N13_130183 [Hibiscus sabdariffa]